MVIRSINGLFSVLLALFAVVQYNDPDFYFWFPIYLTGALWCGFAAARPRLLTRPASRALLAACLGLAVLGTVYFWPTETGFWRQSTWWDSEPAREGMGMMILTVCLLLPVITAVNRPGR